MACKGKLAHLSLHKAWAHRTISEANSKCYLVFEMIYYGLLSQYHSFIWNIRFKGISIRSLKIIDSITIQRFSDLLRGVGRNRLDGGRKKGGIMAHAMLDAFSRMTEFVRMAEDREHNRKVLYHLKLPPNSWLVFDNANNAYQQFD